MTEARAKFIQVLTFIQNHAENQNCDILTITGFMDDREVSRHIIAQAAALPRAKQAGIARFMLSLSQKEAA